MSDVMFCTEKEVRDILLNLAKDSGDQAPFVFVAYREQSQSSLKRSVTFVVQTKEGNEALVNSIVKASTEHEMEFVFDKSDINIQDGNFAVDYLYVRATISPKLI